MNVFMSYRFRDRREPDWFIEKWFVHRICYFLSKQAGVRAYAYGLRDDENWREELGSELEASDAFVLFVSAPSVGFVQEQETEHFLNHHQQNVRGRLVVARFPGSGELQRNLFQLRGYEVTIRREALSEIEGPLAQEFAKAVGEKIGITEDRWLWSDGIPTEYVFAYEKDIIDAFLQPDPDKFSSYIASGCPMKWPDVERKQGVGYSIPDDLKVVIGDPRDAAERILVDARSLHHRPDDPSPLAHCLVRKALTFPEAGPRGTLIFPNAGRNVLTVGILVSGGIAPGVNAVIAGIVERHRRYAEDCPRKEGEPYRLQVFGFRDGLKGLLEQERMGHLDFSDPGKDQEYFRLIANRGGSEVGTSRCDSLLDEVDSNGRNTRNRKLKTILERLDGDGVDILYVIGGDGSMRAAHALSEMAEHSNRELSVVGIPKTMDNDILWVWQAFGFMSAVEEAKDALRQLDVEVRSNPRLCVVQLFGSDSGFVASHAALASGVCDAVLIPEVSFSMRRLSEYVRGRLKERYRPGLGGRSPFGLVVIAETAIPEDVAEYMDDPSVGLSRDERTAIQNFLNRKRRVFGQTPNELRTGGLKIVSGILRRDINAMGGYWARFDVFTNEPRHLLRSIRPSSWDIIFGHRLGCLAVDNAMAGYTDFMISQWLTEYVLVPLPLVVLGRKRVPPNGIFWRSVCANTGQPDLSSGQTGGGRAEVTAKSRASSRKKRGVG